jgi:Recombination endonuclease VII
MSVKSGKEKHPLYQSWYHARRKGFLSSEWRQDFYKFVEEVGYRPEQHFLQRKDNTALLSKDNFVWIWRDKFTSHPDKNAYMREYRKRKPDLHKNIELKKHFGITLEEYQRMSAKQNSVCAICGEIEGTIDNRTNKPRMLAVDHNHSTRQVRALLCRGCNQGIGNFQEDVQRLEKAVQYLKSFLPRDVTSNNL